jgi:hypothetical protein
MISFAKEAGEINIPILIDLFPYYKNIDSQYSENYETAYKLIKKYSTNSKIIRSFPIGCTDIDTSNCDYEGVIYCEDDIFNSLEKTSQLNDISADKPFFIFFGVSQYNNDSNSYDTFEASKFITYFYKDICSHIPNIEAIIYTEGKDEKNDYRITDIPEMLESYKNLNSL